MPRTQRNADCVLDGAMKVLDEEGWTALTPRHVAHTAGVSRTTVLTRHPNRSAIGAAVWNHRIAQTLLTNWSTLIELVDAGKVLPSAVAKAMEPFLFPDQRMRVAAELLFVCRYDASVEDAVKATVAEQLGKWTTPTKSVTQVKAAQRAFLLGIAHGYLSESRRFDMTSVDLSLEFKALAKMISNPSEPAVLPTKNAAYLDEPLTFGTDDPMMETVLRSTLELMGERGFDEVTIENITDASGYTRSVIFNRYNTKLQLFFDATNRMVASAIAKNDEYQSSIASKDGMAIAEACLLREFMRPERHRMRTITFEQIRLSWHDESILEAFTNGLKEHQLAMREHYKNRTDDQIRGFLVTELAAGHGIVTLCDLQPQMWKLPLDVGMVALRS